MPEGPSKLRHQHIGYYKLYSNTEVRGYGSRSGYGVGNFVYWLALNFQSLITPGSGVVNLDNNFVVVYDRATLGGGIGTAGTLAPVRMPASPSPRVRGFVYDHAMPRIPE